MREYVKPTMEGEVFAANEYIAATCGDSGVIYKFKCDAGGGAYGTVYLETNGQDGLQTNGRDADQYLTSTYHACGTSHEADSNDQFLDGYYVNTKWVSTGIFQGHWETTTTPVIVWRGPNGDNTHCTVNLNMDSWETAKS